MRLILALLVAASTVAACSVDPSLTCGASCGDAESVVDGGSDGSTPDVSQSADSQSADAPHDSPVDSTTDGACTVTCPSGSACAGAFCSVPQGTTCSSAVATAGGSGAFDGTVCGGTSPTITTTCSTPITASATFLAFTSGGDPWNVTVNAVNGPLQVEVMSSGCSSSVACYAIPAGQSQLIVVNTNTTLAIVTGGSCTQWQITYVSK